MDETETIILLIIIGIISAIFGKGKQGKGQGSLPKSFSEMRKLVNEQLDQYQLPKITPVVQNVQKEKIVKKTRENQHAAEPMVANSFIQAAVEKSPPKPIEPKKVEPEFTVTGEVDDQTLINGIIWSEIMGEPRARKPYFPRKS